MKLIVPLSLLVVAVSSSANQKGWEPNSNDGTIMVTMQKPLGDETPSKMKELMDPTQKKINRWENAIKGLQSPEKLGVKAWAMLEKDGKKYLVGAKKTAKEMGDKTTDEEGLLVFTAEKVGDKQLKLTPQHPPQKTSLERTSKKHPLKKQSPTNPEEDEPEPDMGKYTKTRHPLKKAISKSKSLEVKAKSNSKKMARHPPTKAISKSKSLEVKGERLSRVANSKKMASLKTAIKSASKKARNLEGKAKSARATKAHAFLETEVEVEVEKMDPITAVSYGVWGPYWGLGWSFGWPLSYPFFSSDSTSSLERGVSQLSGDIANLEREMGLTELEKDKKEKEALPLAWGIWGPAIWWGAWYGAGWLY